MSSPEPTIVVQEWVFWPSHGAEILMQWMRNNEKLFQQDEISVIDVGCGTGVLAIFAAQLWARKVFASDIDPRAVENTLKNAQKNSVTIDARVGNFAEPFKDERFDIVIANLPQEKSPWNQKKKGNEIILNFLQSAGDILKDENSRLFLALNGCTPYRETMHEIRQNWNVENAKGVWMAVKSWVLENISSFIESEDLKIRKKDGIYETPVFYLILKKK